MDIYKALIRSKWDYGSILYGTSFDSQLNALDLIQNKCLPIAIGAQHTFFIPSIDIENNIELKQILEKYKTDSFPIVFDCHVVENENCYPMVSPGATNAAMSGITYKHAEIELLKKHSNKNDDIEAFLSKLKNDWLL